MRPQREPFLAENCEASLPGGASRTCPSSYRDVAVGETAGQSFSSCKRHPRLRRGRCVVTSKWSPCARWGREPWSYPSQTLTKRVKTFDLNLMPESNSTQVQFSTFRRTTICFDLSKEKGCSLGLDDVMQVWWRHKNVIAENFYHMFRKYICFFLFFIVIFSN